MDDTDQTTELRKPTEADWAKLKDIFKRANAGEQKALEELREFLDRNPQVWKIVGDLAKTAEDAWIDVVSSKDALRPESLRRQLAHIREQLVGDVPSAIEKMLGDQITATFLEVKHLEAVSAVQSGTISQAALLLRQLESAQRRHAAAIKSLVQVRHLLQEAEARPRLRVFNAERKMG